MKRLILLFTIIAVLFAWAYQPIVENAYALYYATKVYIAQGGDTLHVKDGGVADINGRADIDSAVIDVATVTSFIGGSGVWSGDMTVAGDSILFSKEAIIQWEAEGDTSSVLLSFSSNLPVITMYGSDGDTWSITMDTNDYALLTGATQFHVGEDMVVTSSGQFGVTEEAITVNYADIDSSGVTIGYSSNDPVITFYDGEGGSGTITFTSDTFTIAGAAVSIGTAINSTAAITTTSTINGYIKQLAITSDTTMTTANFPSGSTITVAGTCEITLPTAAAGLNYTFIALGTDSTIVIAGASDNIDVPGDPNETEVVAAGTADEVLTIETIDATSWKVKSYVGTWAALGD